MATNDEAQYDFETLWKIAGAQPETTTIKLDQIALDFSIPALLDKIIEYAKENVVEKKLDESIFKQLEEHTRRVKGVLDNIDNNDLQGWVQKLTQRLRR